MQYFRENPSLKRTKITQNFYKRFISIPTPNTTPQKCFPKNKYPSLPFQQCGHNFQNDTKMLPIIQFPINQSIDCDNSEKYVVINYDDSLNIIIKNQMQNGFVHLRKIKQRIRWSAEETKNLQKLMELIRPNNQEQWKEIYHQMQETGSRRTLPSYKQKGYQLFCSQNTNKTWLTSILLQRIVEMFMSGKSTGQIHHDLDDERIVLLEMRNKLYSIFNSIFNVTGKIEGMGKVYKINLQDYDMFGHARHQGQAIPNICHIYQLSLQLRKVKEQKDLQMNQTITKQLIQFNNNLLRISASYLNHIRNIPKSKKTYFKQKRIGCMKMQVQTQSSPTVIHTGFANIIDMVLWTRCDQDNSKYQISEKINFQQQNYQNEEESINEVINEMNENQPLVNDKIGKIETCKTMTCFMGEQEMFESE